ncbi:hypothetical protein VUJ46_09635 [Chryseobacterium sp. MYb264]|uniref:hypothetical protein n=1 Tax=Chryseobacterium sp. MYb264 TaxID=2745153 RepID=UPI002E127CAF|nr:hypothetical protein VUJ46_09635 [Chryseobacterium sp. MYb264]
MKTILKMSLGALFLISCGGNDDDVTENLQPQEKKVYNFEYKNYSVKNVDVYLGPFGNNGNPDESYLSDYWSLYKEPTWKKISLDLQNNSLQLISGNSADVTYKVTINSDSVFIAENHEYIGNFNKNESSFTLKRSFQYVKKMPRDNSSSLNISQKVIFGTSTYKDFFGGTLFANPSEMTENQDKVLWSNIDYYYNSL